MTNDTGVDLSIAIASYNTLEYTRQCLESIYKNTHAIVFEVIVIDNNSQDGSQDMIKAEFPKVNLVCNSENLGIPTATNIGISLSSGRYFITMNSDIIVTPGSLEKLVDFMDTHPDTGAATARLVLPDGGEHPLVFGNSPTLKTELLEVFSPFCNYVARLAKIARFGEHIDNIKVQEVPCILWGTAFIVRREVLESVGGQDPIFFVYCEDTDWSMRIKAAGWRLFYVAYSEIIHYGGKSTGQTSADSLAMLCKNRCRLIRKHYGLLSGFTLRMAFMCVFSSYIVRWAIPYFVKPEKKALARENIFRAWRVIRAVISY